MFNSILINLIAPAVMLLVGYWIGRPKTKAEARQVSEQAQGTELENVKNALAIYRGMIEDMEAKLKELGNLKQRVLELEATVGRLERENKTLKRKLEKVN